MSGFKEVLVTDSAIEFIQSNRDQPFFLYLPFFAPHTPFDYQPDEDRVHYKDTSFPRFPEGPRNPQPRRSFDNFHSNRESKTSYSALVSSVDRNVGRVVRSLEEMGLRDNTLIVFTADSAGTPDITECGAKGTRRFPSICTRNPFACRSFGITQAESEADRFWRPMVSSYDFFPAILDYLRIEAPADPRRVGRSYAGFLKDQPPSSWRAELFFEYCHARARFAPSGGSTWNRRTIGPVRCSTCPPIPPRRPMSLAIQPTAKT